jgi:hypothetical protein
MEAGHQDVRMLLNMIVWLILNRLRLSVMIFMQCLPPCGAKPFFFRPYPRMESVGRFPPGVYLYLSGYIFLICPPRQQAGGTQHGTLAGQFTLYFNHKHVLLHWYYYCPQIIVPRENFCQPKRQKNAFLQTFAFFCGKRGISGQQIFVQRPARS